jgi:hypothetical protein
MNMPFKWASNETEPTHNISMYKHNLRSAQHSTVLLPIYTPNIQHQVIAFSHQESQGPRQGDQITLC